jgi:chromosome partitioning protein
MLRRCAALERMAAMHTIAIASRKGGVGKTTVAVNLAAAFAREGRRVLVVDMDSQGNAGRVLLDEKPTDGAITTAHVMLGSSTITEAIRPSNRPGVDIAPASKELTGALMSIVAKVGRESILRRAMARLDYDVAIIDTTPEQQLGTVNSLVAASHVLMPFLPEATALEGMVTTSEAMAELADVGIAAPTLLGCVQIAYDRRIAVTEETRQQVREAYGDRLFETTVRSNSTFLLCSAWHRDIFAMETTTRPPRRGSDDFAALAIEAAKRVGLPAAEAAA